MSHSVSFRAEAFADVAEAFSWYQAVLHTRRDPTTWHQRAQG